MTTPTNQQIIDQYLLDREKIKRIKQAAADAIASLETFQSNREAFLLKTEDPTIVEFLTDLYINGRDGKAAAEAKKKDIGLKQNEIESWLLKMLDKLKSKGFKTEFGTVYPTRKEGVSVEDWDAFLESEILRPAAEELWNRLIADDLLPKLKDDTTISPVRLIVDVLRGASHLEFLNKAVNKTAVLERLGDLDEKTQSRPNPAPAGVKYTAIRTVGVRKN